MDQETARELLLQLMHQLPTGIWCMLRDDDSDTTTMAKMLGRPVKEIDALLINTGMCKETVKGNITLSKKQWDVFCTTHIDHPSSSIQIGSIRRTLFVVNGNPEHITPAIQEQRRLGSIPASPDLPPNIQRDLRVSWDAYDDKKKNTDDEQISNNNAAKTTKDGDKKKKKKNEYPLLSKLFSKVEHISLQHPEIDSFCKSILTEIVQLHHESADIPLSYKHPNGKDMTLEPLEDCSKKREREPVIVVSPKHSTVSS